MILKGFDSIEFGLYFENYDASFEPYLSMFAFHKRKAQETSVEQEIDLHGVTVKIGRAGIRFYSYTLTTNDFIVWFRDSSKGEYPPVRVRFLSGFLWSMGLADCVKSFYKWFSNFNLQISETKLSRLDICADSDEAQFIEGDRKGIVTRAKGIAIHGADDSTYFQGKKFSGFVVGRNPVLARIYNKSLEIKKSAKVWFRDLWIKHGWNEQKDVWRVEFQLRGDVLKEFGIRTLDDVLPIEANLWSSLTQEWLTIRTPKDDNVSRWPIKRKWKVIQRAFLNQEASPLIRKKVIVGDSIRTLNQIAGLVISLAARNECEDAPDALNMVDDWIHKKLNQKNSTFQAETELRKLRFIQN